MPEEPELERFECDRGHAWESRERRRCPECGTPQVLLLQENEDGELEEVPLIECCPDPQGVGCDSARISRKVPSGEYLRSNPEPWRCGACSGHFEEPDFRKRQATSPAYGNSPHVRALLVEAGELEPEEAEAEGAD